MKHINILRRMTMPLPELEIYYRERRKQRFDRGKPLGHIRLREAFGPVFARLLTLDRLFRRQSVAVLGERMPYKEQTIFACTHIGGSDLENIYETLRRSCWWFVGDPCILYKDISGLLVYLNGSIFMDTGDKADRRIAYLRAVELLKGGGSLMIFPEGARNGSENLPVMPLFSGTARMAMETSTRIVPVAIEQYDRRFVIRFGGTLSPADFDCADELTQKLRDVLATLKWEIWESEGLKSRASLPEDCAKRFVETFAARIQPWDTLESVERTRYHTKAELAQREVLAAWERLIPRRENAFLLRKHETD